MIFMQANVPTRSPLGFPKCYIPMVRHSWAFHGTSSAPGGVCHHTVSRCAYTHIWATSMCGTIPPYRLLLIVLLKCISCNILIGYKALSP